MNSEKNFDSIMLFDNVIDEKLANEVILEINKAIDEGYSNKEEYGNKYNVICDYIHCNNIKDIEKRRDIDSQLFKVVSTIVKKVSKKIKLHIDEDSGYCLRKIHGATRRHRDGIHTKKSILTGKNLARNLSIIIALNDDYEDGEFYFPNQGRKFTLKKYQAVAFPPYWTHPHQVSEPSGGHRYTVNTWCAEFLNN